MELPRPFGEYILLSQLGQGGMARVFLAKRRSDQVIGHPVALKIVNPSISKDIQLQNMMRQEAERAVNFNHGNVTSILDFGSINEQFFIAMEYVSGKTLWEIVDKLDSQQRSFEPEEILFIISQAAAGLDYAHRFGRSTEQKRQGLIHRDVCLENIMVSYEGEIKVIDFGVANVSEAGANTSGHWGRLHYQAPEQVNGGEADALTDIYSLGLVLWEMCTKDSMFRGVGKTEVIDMKKTGVIPRVADYDPDCPKYIVDILKKATAFNKEDRYQNAGEMHITADEALAKHFPRFKRLDLRKKMYQLFHTEIVKEYEMLHSEQGINKDYTEPLAKRFSGDESCQAQKLYFLKAPMAALKPVRTILLKIFGFKLK